MKGYYLASIFNYIHLQQLGNLNLWGISSSVPFLKDALEKNFGGAKVKVNVFRHGIYKNAPNSLTESGFTKPHKENVSTIAQYRYNHCDLEYLTFHLNIHQ